jgi:hypothetical protein
MFFVVADTTSTASVDVEGDMSDEDESVALLVEDVSVATLDFEAECRIDGVSSDSRAFGSWSVVIRPIVGRWMT